MTTGREQYLVKRKVSTTEAAMTLMLRVFNLVLKLLCVLGAYGWLVANYLKNSGKMPHNNSTYTYGALDLGGASTQLTFRPTGSILAHQFPLQVDKMEYSLYTHSYLYYGVDQALLRFDNNHVGESGINPCYPKDYTNHITKVSGASDWSQCLESVAKLFNKLHQCFNGDGKEDRCSFNGVYQPPLENKSFVLMSAFVYIYDYLGLKIGSDTQDLQRLDKRAQIICNLTKSQQRKHYKKRTENMPSERTANNPDHQCFNAAYAYHLLSTGFGMPIVNAPIEIWHHIGGTNLGWSLGMMIVEANKLGWTYKEQGYNPTVHITYNNTANLEYKLLFMSVTPSFIALSCVLGVLLFRAKRQSRILEPYLPVSAIDDALGDETSPRKGR